MAEDDGLKELMSTLLRAGAVRRSDDSALLMCPEDDVRLGDEGLSKTMVACGAGGMTQNRELGDAHHGQEEHRQGVDGG